MFVQTQISNNYFSPESRKKNQGSVNSVYLCVHESVCVYYIHLHVVLKT